MPTIEQALREATEQLRDSDSPRLDAEVLLAHSLERPRSYLYTWPERELSEGQQRQFQALLDRRSQGEPVAHLLGKREFWSLELAVSPDTLIPRPDTELLVEQVLELGRADEPLRLADLGTGSGAIALAIASERPKWQVVAVERSEEALAVARANAGNHGIENVHFHQGSWFEPLLGERFDIIVSNPPYIASDDPHLQQGDARFDPRSALVAGSDGLDDIRQIVNLAPEHLSPGGRLLLEHGYEQQSAVIKLLQDGGYTEVEGLRDYGGNPRMVTAQWGISRD